MIYRKLLTFLFCLILFSCIDKSNAVSLSEIDIVRTSRDSSYFKNGTLFTGFVKKYTDDRELLSFSVKDGKIDGQYIEYYSSGSIKKKTNFKNGILDGKYSKFYKNNLLMIIDVNVKNKNNQQFTNFEFCEHVKCESHTKRIECHVYDNSNHLQHRNVHFCLSSYCLLVPSQSLW